MSLRSGSSIIEVVIATALISMGVIAALALTNQSQKSSNYAKILNMASAHNSALADYLRTQKNALGYANLKAKFEADSTGGSATYCYPTLPESVDGFYATVSGACTDDQVILGTIFLRTLTVDTTNLDSGIIPVTITTTWQDTLVRSNTLSLELSQWN